MGTEADTCRKYIVPALQRVGWDDPPHAIAEQRSYKNKTQAALDALLPSVLDRAFKGEL